MKAAIELSGGIVLKALEASDAPVIFEAICEDRAHLSRWLPFVEETVRQGIGVTEAYVASVTEPPGCEAKQVFAILQDGAFAGLIGLFGTDWDNGKAEMGYWLRERFLKKGLVTRSAACLIGRAFRNLGLNRISLRIAVGNSESRKVAERLGFTLEGVERDAERFSDGHFVDAEVFGLLAREWRL